MRLSYYIAACLPLLLSLPVFSQWGGWGSSYNTGSVISSNGSGTQGDYHVEFWQQNSGESGSMTLGEGGDFNCQWGYNKNILFRKGKRPGSRDLVVVYDADYNPQGNSYLCVYGWFKNPLVEYYIIESWGTWKPPGQPKKSSFETEEGKYDIFENTRNGASIEGDNVTFQQYWSVRTERRTEGAITVGDHFQAWKSAGMNIGSFYEVAFNVEAYRSGGGSSADVKMQIMTKNEYEEYIGTGIGRDFGSNKTAIIPLQNNYKSSMLYNALGQKIAGISEREPVRGLNSVLLNSVSCASGVYYIIPDKK